MSWIPAGISLVSGLLGKHEGKAASNAAKMNMFYAQQGLDKYITPYNEFYGMNAGNIDGAQSNPWKQSIAQNMRDALYGYGSSEQNLLRGKMMDANNLAVQGAQNRLNEGMNSWGAAPGGNSGIRAALMAQMQEQGMLNNQGINRDLFLGGEELKRNAANQLGQTAMGIMNMPLNYSNAEMGLAGVNQASAQQSYQNAGQLAQGLTGMWANMQTPRSVGSVAQPEIGVNAGLNNNFNGYRSFGNVPVGSQLQAPNQNSWLSTWKSQNPIRSGLWGSN